MKQPIVILSIVASITTGFSQRYAGSNSGTQSYYGFPGLMFSPTDQTNAQVAWNVSYISKPITSKDLTLKPLSFVLENRVRIKTSLNLYEGIVRHIDTTSVQIELESKHTTETLLRENIEKIERRLGKKSMGLKGAAIGFGLGAVFGFGLGYASNPAEDVPQLQMAGTYAFFVGLAGAAVGAITKDESWHEISYEELLLEK